MDWTTVIDYVKNNSIAFYGALLSTALGIELLISKYKPKVTIGQICHPIHAIKRELRDGFGQVIKEYVDYDLVIVNNSEDLIYITDYGILQKIGLFKYNVIIEKSNAYYGSSEDVDRIALPPHSSVKYYYVITPRDNKKIIKPKFFNYIVLKGFIRNSVGKEYIGKSYKYKVR